MSAEVSAARGENPARHRGEHASGTLRLMTDDVAALETFLRRRLREPLPGADAHWRFAPYPALDNWSPDLVPETARRAAALLLIYPGEDGAPTLPLTVRREDLPHHPGQVSLPGGALDPGETPESAALREATEEIGIDPHAVRIAGSLSSLWVIVSNFVVYPFVAVTDSRPSFVPAPGEVAHLLEVPVRDVRDQSRLHWDSWRRGHVDVHYPFFDLGGPAVWGATAMMLGEFACLFDDRHSPPKRTAKPDEIR